MAKNNFLVLIRKRIEEIHKEYSALRNAYETLEKVAGLRGRKVSIPELTDLIKSEKSSKPVKKGKRGRPRKVSISESIAPTNESKKPKGKRGRKKLIKSIATKDASSISKKEKETIKSKIKSTEKTSKKPVGRPRLNKEIKKSESTPKATNNISSASKKAPKNSRKSGKKGPRTRVPNLASRITEIIKTANRFVTNAEITDKLASTYPSKDKAQLSKYLSVVMAQMKGRKEAGVVVKDHKGKRMRSGLWGLPNWFENGKPKNEFLK